MEETKKIAEETCEKPYSIDDEDLTHVTGGEKDPEKAADLSLVLEHFPFLAERFDEDKKFRMKFFRSDKFRAALVDAAKHDFLPDGLLDMSHQDFTRQEREKRGLL